MNGWDFWVDRGGTFVDLIGRDPSGRLHVRKVLSQDNQSGDPAVRAIKGLLGCSSEESLPSERIRSVRLGTTVATNALLEGKGAPLLLVTNRGFGDQLWIGDQHRDELFALKQCPRPFLAGEVIEVSGRIDAEGIEQEPLRLDRDLIDRLHGLSRNGFSSAVVALMHAYRNPAHEQALAEQIRLAGFEAVVCSHQVSAQPRFVPRGQTSLVEGAVAPSLLGYLREIQLSLGTATPLRVMTSSGSLQRTTDLLAKDTILSGPAAGMVGAVAAARTAGFDQVPVVGFDMGGTSTDVFCVASADEHNLRQVQEQTEIAGLQLLAPRLPIETVAAGGGSILEQDGGRLRVGPRSAGAVPGPACYRAGGPLTITDANLLLGRLQPDRFPAVFGSSRDLPPDLAVVRQRFAELSQSLSQAPEQLAEGALQLAIERMAAAIHRVSLHRGEDIRDGVLVAYGGAGGQHSCRLAEELGLRTVLLHPMAGVLSAYGMGQARQRRRVQKHIGSQLNLPLLLTLQRQAGELALKARSLLEEQGDEAGTSLHGADRWASIDVRYASSEQTLVLPLAIEQAFTEQSVDELIQSFQSLHQRRFGYCVKTDQSLMVEMLSMELSAPQQYRPPQSGGAADPVDVTPNSELVPLHLPGCGWCRVPLLDRSNLVPGQRLSGPALISENTAFTVLEPNWTARIDVGDVLVLEHQQTSPARDIVQKADAQDPVRSELFRHRFMAIAQQMGERLRQSSRSVNIRERLDFSCALFDADGGLVANAPHIPVHLGSMSESVRDLLAQLAACDLPSLHPGDTLLSNDPFHGGTHLPDITAITPVFVAGSDPSFFVASRGHHSDVGGSTPGSMPSFSRRIEDEGLLLRNLLFIRDGTIQHADWQAACHAMEIPPRNPQELLADLQAQVAANQAGVEGLLQLVAREGLLQVMCQMDLLQQHAAGCVRKLLDRLSDSRQQAELDDGSQLQVKIQVDRQQQRLSLDFSGSSDQRPGNLNAPLAVTRASVLYVIRCLLDCDLPLNEGCFQPLDLKVPLGSMLNPCPPAAVVAGNVEVSQALCNLLFAAFGVLAAGQGTMNNLTFGDGQHQYYETIAGGGGAGQGFDGSVGLQSHMTNSRLTDPEILESRFPVRLESFSVRTGSGGRGQWCGGDGLERIIRFLEPMNVSLITGSRRVPPDGLNGGEPGACGVNTRLRCDGSEQLLPGSVQFDLAAGEAIRLLTPGGGGIGSLS